MMYPWLQGFKSIAVLLLSLVLVSAVQAGDQPAASDILISDVRSFATPPGVPHAAVYLNLQNQGEQAQQLIALRTAVAEAAEMHNTRQRDGMLEMYQLEQVEIPPQATVSFERGGLHIMLLGLSHPLVAAEHFKLTLRFASGEERTVMVQVRDARDQAESGGHHHHH